MLALSLWQPWASAIALGHKAIETRHWFTRVRGEIAIHAAKRWTPDEREDAEAFARQYDDRLRTPPLGVIVATAILVDVQRTDDLVSIVSDKERAFGNYAPGRFGFLLRDVVALAEPIPFKGAQGFFDVPNDLIGRAPIASPQRSLL